MRGAVELVAFLALSAALHAGIALHLPEGGGGGQGAQEQDMATLQASPESLAALIESWQDAPDVTVPDALPIPQIADPIVPATAEDMPLYQHQPNRLVAPDTDNAPDPDTDALPAPARIDAMTQPTAPNLPMPRDTPPDMPRDEDRTERRQPVPTLSRPDLGTAPVAETTPTRQPRPDLAIATSPRPEIRPDTAGQSRNPQASSPPAPARQAAGAGEGAIAGSNLRPTQQPSLSAGERQSRMASWGAQIQRRIERARPRVRGTGRAILHLTITRTGQLAAVGVAQSSGNAAVDQAAMQAVQRAGRFPSAPDGLTEASYGFSLPVTFR